MVSTTASKIQYTGNGATTVFAYDFQIQSQSHLVVVLTVRRR